MKWMKTEELDDFFLIGNKNVNKEIHSYNSLDYLMDSSEAKKLLKGE